MAGQGIDWGSMELAHHGEMSFFLLQPVHRETNGKGIVHKCSKNIELDQSQQLIHPWGTQHVIRIGRLFIL